MLISINCLYICGMKYDKTKYLVVSIGEMHEELMETIKQNAVKEKASVSHYVRSLLYKAISSEPKSATAGMDDPRAEGSMGGGVRESA